MNKIQLGIDAISTTPIRIGFEGENVHTQVTFFWTVLRSKYPDAVASLSIKPPVGDIYPKSVTQDGNKVVWDVTASDTANPGSGEYQLTFTDGEEIIKTYIGNFTVNDSIIGDGEAPDPIQDWVADANAVLGELSEISASVTTLEAGESATVEVTEVGGHKNLAFGIPAGEKGEQGEQGEPGDPAPAEEVIPAVNAYLAEVITNPDSPPLDRTLSSSSAAAPADMVGDLKSAIKFDRAVYNNGQINLGELKSGKYIYHTNGEEGSSADWSATNFINVSGLDKIYIHSANARKQNNNAFYDSGKNYIPNSSFITYPGLTVVSVPSGASYVRLSELTTVMQEMTVYPSVFEKIIEENAMPVFDKGEINYGTLKPQTYILNGAEAGSNDYSATGFIPVYDFTKLIVYFHSATTNSFNAFYDESATFIPDSTFETKMGYNEINVPIGAKYVRLSKATSQISSMKIYAPVIYDLQKQITTNNNDLNGKIGTLSNLPTTDKTNLVASARKMFGTKKVTDSISGYDQHNGVIIYLNLWWQFNNENYKHIAIPITAKKTIVKIKAGSNACMIGGLKEYSGASDTPPTLSDYWFRRIEIPAGKEYEFIIPQDVNYLIVNVLYNNVACVAEFEMTEIDYEESCATRDMVGSLQGITIAAHNVRHFSDGPGNGCPTALVSTNLPLWKAHVCDWMNTDFLCITEWYPYFDRDHTIDAYETIFKQFFPYKYELPGTNPVTIILSKHPGVFTNFDLPANVWGDGLPMVVCDVGGKRIAVVCWLQSSTASAETRIEHYQNAVACLAQYDGVIVAGDFNTETGLEELATWTEAGYTLGNGGYWGTINTWENQTPNDNIVTKGFIYKKFEAGEAVSSDHKAVRAFLSFNV